MLFLEIDRFVAEIYAFKVSNLVSVFQELPLRHAPVPGIQYFFENYCKLNPDKAFWYVIFKKIS